MKNPRALLFWFRLPNLTRYVSVIILSVLLVLFATALYFGWFTTPDIVPKPFPIGVLPEEKSIVEDPSVANYFATQIAPNVPANNKTGWLYDTMEKFTAASWYQNMASPIGIVLVIRPGERKEEVVDNFGDIMRWDEEERAKFGRLIENEEPYISEGKFYPDHYLVDRGATPEEIAKMVINDFNDQVLTRYPDDIEKQVPLQQALVIASILEREAYDFEDMREISGVIWNRLFTGMKLQIDATLQYAKGSRPTGPWWPAVLPQDKYIDSPYNTYQNTGLPPGAIGNPSLESILAAINPVETDCLFYFHDKHANFHCSPTYEGHVELLKEYYGQGK